MRQGREFVVKRIAVSMQNRVFAESVMLMLQRSGEFRPVRVAAGPPERALRECIAAQPEILLMDVTPTSPATDLAGRMQLIEGMRREQPGCKVAILCDETAHPTLAREVMRAKQAGRIDAFFYASVTAEYLTAALDSI